MDPWATADPPVFLLQVRIRPARPFPPASRQLAAPGIARWTAEKVIPRAQVLPALRTVRLTVGTAPDVVASVKMTSPTEVTVHFLRGDSPLPPLVIKIPHAVTLGSTGTVPGSGGAPLVTEAKFSMVVPHAEAFTAGELAGVSWLPGGPGGEEGMGEDAKMKGLNEVGDTGWLVGLIARGPAACLEWRRTAVLVTTAPPRRLTPRSSQVLCDTCGAGLIPPGSFKRILPLPSPFWHEVPPAPRARVPLSRVRCRVCTAHPRLLQTLSSSSNNSNSSSRNLRRPPREVSKGALSCKASGRSCAWSFKAHPGSSTRSPPVERNS